MNAAEECRRNQESIQPATRVMFCPRCGHATGGGYGHYTSWCEAARARADDHFCCPESCALRDGEAMDPRAACHPAPGDEVRWARETDAARERRT